MIQSVQPCSRDKSEQTWGNPTVFCRNYHIIFTYHSYGFDVTMKTLTKNMEGRIVNTELCNYCNLEDYIIAFELM